MKIELITTASDYDKTAKLRESLERHGWPYHIIIHPWRGFGDKILKTYEYLKSSDVTHFFYSDSYDTYALAPIQEAIAKVNGRDMIWSSEKACYPHAQLAEMYPENPSPWKYLNGGGWFASKDAFIKMVEEDMPECFTVDQVYFTNQLLTKKNITLDYDCEIFQTIAFCDFDKEFTVERGRVFNNFTKQYPILFHGNGHTPLNRIYELTGI